MLGAAGRTLFRSAWLIAELCIAFSLYPWKTGRSRPSGPAAQSLWLQETCRRLLRVFHLEVHVQGNLPKTGLLVCNHLSYLDILVIGATVPSRFVSKSEVRNWPVFGLFARLAGTIFVDRQSRRDTSRAGSEIKARLCEEGLIVLFPEGTSSAGENVLPFKPALFGAVAGTDHAVSAAAIDYAVADGSVSEDICYWGDMTLLPHLLKVRGKKQITARLSFASMEEVLPDRKQLARSLHSEVTRLHAAFAF